MRFETAVLTEPGSRPVNQDAVAHTDCCWVLADGLGGHGGGEQAARIAVETVVGQASAGEGLQSFFLAANQALIAAQQARPALAQMRTTLVVLLITNEQATWGHIGDSRLYHLRHARIAAQTLDHSFAQTLAGSGQIPSQAIRFHEDRSRLLRTLGTPACQPEFAAPVPLRAGDAFLLVSDGFWEPVTERELEIEFAKSGTPREWLERIRARAFAAPITDRDNLSAIAVFIHAT
jgi:serine/threonine protein phosphatase PrpC